MLAKCTHLRSNKSNFQAQYWTSAQQFSLSYKFIYFPFFRFLDVRYFLRTHFFEDSGLTPSKDQAFRPRPYIIRSCDAQGDTSLECNHDIHTFRFLDVLHMLLLWSLVYNENPWFQLAIISGLSRPPVCGFNGVLSRARTMGFRSYSI